MPAFVRREFLKQSSTAILGFPFAAALVEAAESGKKPLPVEDVKAAGGQNKIAPVKTATPEELLAAAKERMKQESKLGVVILVPAEAKVATKLATDLATLLGGKNPDCAVDDGEIRFGMPPPAGSGNPEAHQLFCQAVFVCLPADAARKAFPKLQADSAALLLDNSGKPLEEVKASDTLFSSGFTSQMTSLIHGKQGERLAATIQVQRSALGKETAERVEACLRSLDSDQFFVRQQASAVLAELAPRATALLAAELRKKPALETRRRVEYFFEKIYSSASEERPSVRLPFGAQWEGRRIDTCPFCGLSSVADSSRLFLRFLVQEKK